jgi:hypothetical protein
MAAGVRDGQARAPSNIAGLQLGIVPAMAVVAAGAPLATFKRAV